MRLVSLTYREFMGQDAEWSLDGLTLSQINLLVAKNATGKTRTINVINSLANLLTGEKKEVFVSGTYDALFENGDGKKKWNYSLEIENSAVVKEDLFCDGEHVLQRARGGYGRILAEDIEGKPVSIKFDVPASQVAAFAKFDKAQHSFLKPLRDWAASVRYFKFGYEIDPLTLALAVKLPVSVEVDEKQTNQLVPIFDKARKQLGTPYLQAVISDMKELGYEITDLAIRRPQNLMANVILPGELAGVSVKEEGLRGYVDQPSISHGMFRVLSLISQLNYYLMANKPVCVLVDDIGEGLDFERSRALIDLLRRKIHAAESSFQLVMSTNNRFVMNHVPLEEWALLQRVGHSVRVRNYANSRDTFDHFKMTGLSNFDFLRYDFINEDQEALLEEIGEESGK